MVGVTVPTSPDDRGIAAAVPPGAVPPGAVTPPRAQQRPPLVRPRAERVVGGVCLGLAAHLGVPVAMVRFVMAVSVLVNGFGALLYLWLWAFTPAATGSPALVAGSPVPPAGSPAPVVGAPVAVAASGAGHSVQPGRRRWAGSAGRDGSRRTDLLLGAVLLVVGLTMLGTKLGYDVQLGAVIPLSVVVGGAVLAYAQLDEVERHRWALRAGVGTRAAVLRMGGGLALVLTGTVSFLLQDTDWVTAGRALVAVLAVLAGTALVLAPWGVRMWRDLDSERAARIREAERADLAAHLHDSVLQTLALIQRRSSDCATVTRLARSQERDLRDWLYGPRPNDGGTLTTEVRATAADVEDRHGVAVDVVFVGDRPLDERVSALVAALREAIVNAVRHAGAPVQVYVECGPDAVEAFVRDRGPGFDLRSVPADRLGVRESIIARTERYGGSAVVRSRAGEGTEVRLVLPAMADSPGQQEGGPS